VENEEVGEVVKKVVIEEVGRALGMMPVSVITMPRGSGK
jgi:predicted Zn-dependent protease with MMP-like domain